MIPEVAQNRPLGDLLRGVSIILASEPEVSLQDALERSRFAEDRNYIDLNAAQFLIEKVRKELDLNGDGELTRDHARSVLRHMLKDPPWNPMRDKHELP